MLYNIKRSFCFLNFIIILLIFSPSKTYADKSENYLGNKDAKVTIIEYASMTCDHCGDFHKNIFPKIKEKYIDTNKVRFVFRDFPLDKQALYASILAKCAPKDKYFDFVYLDGDHSYEGVKKDLDSWYPKLKKFGVMCGDDYGNMHLPVIEAVSEFVYEHKLLVTCSEDKQFWFVKV